MPAAFTLVAVLAGLLLLPAGAQPDPATCTGYPEKRIRLETQAWWTEPGGSDATSEHVHTETCWPWSGYGKAIGGVVRFDVRVQLHNHSGTSNEFSIGMDGNGKVARQPLVMGPCLQCEKTITVNLDTTKIQDGRHDFRFHLNTFRPNGNRLFSSSEWMAFIDNPTPGAVKPSGKDNPTKARGWYTTTGYTNSLFTDPLPAGPISGTWTFSSVLGTQEIDALGGNPGTATHAIYVDPAFHATPPDYGRILRRGSGQFNGDTSLDTRTLPDGVHRLVLRGDRTLPDGGRASGLQVVYFTVQNGATPTQRVHSRE